MKTEWWEAFDQGYEAFGTWMDFADNPYDKGTQEHEFWSQGFSQAEADINDEDYQ